MIRQNKKWRWIGSGLLIAILLLWTPIKHLSWSVRLALSIQKLATGTQEQKLAVIETKVRRQDGIHSYEALCYRPSRTPATTAVILAPGLSEQGCYHPRMIALSHALADKGLLVITPDIKEFREFRIAVEPIDQLVFWHRQVTAMEGGQNVRKIGLAGISFSGTLALIAAARPEIRENVTFVLGIGPYYDLIQCTKEWFAAGDAREGNGSYPTRFYAKWLIMRAALEMLPSPGDHQFLDQVLNDLLLSKKVPPAGANLTPEGLRWYNLAITHPGQTDEELSASIQEHLKATIYPKLNPQNALSGLRCPLFLIHGAYDDLIPSRESEEFQRRYARTHLLISPFLTHTHPTDKKLTLRQKLAAGWDTLKFCYQLARAIQ
jgi:dienelactone hydrolase